MAEDVKSMGLATAFRTCMRKYAQFHGRASRPEFWWFYLALFLIQLPLQVLMSFAVVALFVPVWTEGASGNTTELGFSDLYWGPLIVTLALSFIVQLVLLVPMLAAQSRRLHDAGQPAYWLLLHLIGAGIVPLVMCIMDPTPGPNAYGLEPARA